MMLGKFLGRGMPFLKRSFALQTERPTENATKQMLESVNRVHLGHSNDIWHHAHKLH